MLSASNVSLMEKEMWSAIKAGYSGDIKQMEHAMKNLQKYDD